MDAFISTQPTLFIEIWSPAICFWTSLAISKFVILVSLAVMKKTLVHLLSMWSHVGIVLLRSSSMLVTTPMRSMSGLSDAFLLSCSVAHLFSLVMTILIKSSALLQFSAHPQQRIWLSLATIWHASTSANYPSVTSSLGNLCMQRQTLLHLICYQRCWSSTLRSATQWNSAWSTPTSKACTMKMLSLKPKSHLTGLGTILSQQKSCSRRWSGTSLSNSTPEENTVW